MPQSRPSTLKTRFLWRTSRGMKIPCRCERVHSGLAGPSTRQDVVFEPQSNKFLISASSDATFSLWQ